MLFKLSPKLSALAAAAAAAATAVAVLVAAVADVPLRLAAFTAFSLAPFVNPLLWLGAIEWVPLTILLPFLPAAVDTTTVDAAAAAAAAAGNVDDDDDDDEFFATFTVVNIVFGFLFDWMQRTHIKNTYADVDWADYIWDGGTAEIHSMLAYYHMHSSKNRRVIDQYTIIEITQIKFEHSENY